MTATLDVLAEQALKLPYSERAELAERLLLSLEPPGEAVSEAEASAAWAEVIRRRSDDVASGRVKPLDWEDAKQLLRDRLAARQTT